jgi:hypothetical protein
LGNGRKGPLQSTQTGPVNVSEFMMSSRFNRPHTRTLARSGSASLSGLALVEAMEPRLVLALNPSAEEQYMLELLNRFRTDPQAELDLLTNSLSGEARSSDPDINSALDFFNVSGPVLQSQWTSLISVPALAWDEALYNMAQLQSENMILDDMQEHNLPGRPGLAARADLFDYTYTILGENIFAYAEGVLHGHAAFAIDWGSGPNGIQNPPGHRQSMMSSQFREVGIRILPESAQSTEVGPLVMTQNFGNRQSFGNSWLLGVVFDDNNDDEFYNIGEALSGITVTASGGAGTFSTTSMSAGGYQMQLPAGTYTVTFSGGGFGADLVIPDVVVGSTNAKLDARAGDVSPVPDIKVTGNGISIGPGDSTPDVADHTAFGTLGIDAEPVVRTFTVINDGTTALTINGSPRVVISDDSAGVFTLTMDLALPAIEPGGSLQFTISFDPTLVGTYGATITINTNDLESPEFRFEIEGVAVSLPRAIVFGRGNEIPDGSSTTDASTGTWFGAPNVEDESTIRTFTIRNDGTSDLELIGRVRIGGRDTIPFRVISQPTIDILAPGATTTFTIRFDPGSRGPKQARVLIETSDPAASTYNFLIRGRGVVTPTIAVRGNSRPILDGDESPRALDNTDFGMVNVEDRNRRKDFMLRNEGRGLMHLTTPLRVNLTGAHADDFQVIIRPAEFIASDGRSGFSIRFNPSDVGTRSAWVVIRTNDPLTPRFTFKLTGEGFEAA